MESVPTSDINAEEAIHPPGPEKTLEWITALSAADLPYRLSRTDAGWCIHVPPGRAEAAREEIAAYERDNENWPPPGYLDPPRIVSGPVSWAAAWCAGFITAFYVWLGPFDAGDPLLRAAAADAAAIRGGEWWRAITALAVHSDAAHLAGNVLCLSLIGHALCRAVGGGVAVALLVAAGYFGNQAVAYVSHSMHLSVGASTAAFGAIGALAMIRTVDSLKRGAGGTHPGGRIWLPLAAGTALLAMLGTGPRSDLLAHCFGFIAGALLVLPVALTGTAWIRPWGQKVIQLAALLTVLFAWREVFRMR